TLAGGEDRRQGKRSQAVRRGKSATAREEPQARWAVAASAGAKGRHTGGRRTHASRGEAGRTDPYGRESPGRGDQSRLGQETATDRKPDARRIERHRDLRGVQGADGA